MGGRFQVSWVDVIGLYYPALRRQRVSPQRANSKIDAYSWLPEWFIMLCRRVSSINSIKIPFSQYSSYFWPQRRTLSQRDFEKFVADWFPCCVIQFIPMRLQKLFRLNHIRQSNDWRLRNRGSMFLWGIYFQTFPSGDGTWALYSLDSSWIKTLTTWLPLPWCLLNRMPT